MSRKAFTLAEVLLTLTIIGIIAAVTIPSLIYDINNQTNITAWRKAYSALSNATNMIIRDEGGDVTDIMTTSKAYLSYAKYMNAIKTCSPGNTLIDGCWHLPDSYKYLNGAHGTDLSAQGGFILADGTLMLAGGRAPACDDLKINCGWLIVDVNGFKKPNIVGVDIFAANVYKTRIEPQGGVNEDSSAPEYIGCDPEVDNGYGCSTIKLYE